MNNTLALILAGGRGKRMDMLCDVRPKPALPFAGRFRVIELNRQAYAGMKVEKKMVIVPGATHLFEEPGTLAEVARLAAEWFTGHLGTT